MPLAFAPASTEKPPWRQQSEARKLGIQAKHRLELGRRKPIMCRLQIRSMNSILYIYIYGCLHIYALNLWGSGKSEYYIYMYHIYAQTAVSSDYKHMGVYNKASRVCPNGTVLHRAHSSRLSLNLQIPRRPNEHGCLQIVLVT